MRWRVYCDNGTTFSDEDGLPSDAPRRGVIVIVEKAWIVGRSTWKDCDYYWWADEGWCGGDMAGLLDYLGRVGLATVLQGRTIPDAQYREIVAQALNDPDFPPKSAKYPREKLDG